MKKKLEDLIKFAEKIQLLIVITIRVRECQCLDVSLIDVKSTGKLLEI